MSYCFIDITDDLNFYYIEDTKARRIALDDKETLDKFIMKYLANPNINSFIYGRVENFEEFVKPYLDKISFKVVDLKRLSDILVGDERVGLTKLVRTLAKVNGINANECQNVKMMARLWSIYHDIYKIDLDYLNQNLKEVMISSEDILEKEEYEKLNLRTKDLLVDNYKNKEIKKLAFIDLEYSNCLNGIPKICELSYIITDLDFNILEEKEYVINPGSGYENDFLIVNSNKPIHLKYEANDFEEYRKAKSFDNYLVELQAFFSDEKMIYFFYSPLGDILGLDLAFKKYQSKLNNFILVDTQSLFLAKYRHRPSLSKVSIDEFGSEISNDTFHSSLTDAYWTMNITKRFSKYYLEEKLGLEVVLNATSSSSYLAYQEKKRVSKIKTEIRHLAFKDILGEKVIFEVRNNLKKH